tara:strand:- start:28 stop:345 length:318 start_codon:yes stop_codon:yes gene_type:complete
VHVLTDVPHQYRLRLVAHAVQEECKLAVILPASRATIVTVVRLQKLVQLFAEIVLQVFIKVNVAKELVVLVQLANGARKKVARPPQIVLNVAKEHIPQRKEHHPR